MTRADNEEQFDSDYLRWFRFRCYCGHERLLCTRCSISSLREAARLEIVVSTEIFSTKITNKKPKEISPSGCRDSGSSAGRRHPSQGWQGRKIV
jgi:hypothetical protein